MTSNARLASIATFHARSGHADRLLERLLHAAGLVAETPGNGEPVGGARMLRGTIGATRFSILDAPDLSQDAELLGRSEHDRVGEARYVREQLEAVQTGLTHYRLRPGRSQAGHTATASPRRSTSS